MEEERKIFSAGVYTLNFKTVTSKQLNEMEMEKKMEFLIKGVVVNNE
jgi:hypothetical protein